MQPVTQVVLPSNDDVSTPNYAGSACSGVLAGQFHHGTKKDFLGSCYFSHAGNYFFDALMNQGNGTFQPAEAWDAEGPFSQPILSVDLNGDGLSDLVLIPAPLAAAPSFSVQMSSSAGNGTFSAPVNYTVTGVNVSYVLSVAAGDFEDNGRMDLAVLASNFGGEGGSPHPNTLAIFHNNGSGVFTQVASYPLKSTINDGPFPIVAVGDLNGDHKVDLAVVYPGASGTLVPYLSEGNGKFTVGSSYSVGGSAIGAAIGNFDDNGYGSIAIATTTGLKVFLGDSKATFTTSKSTAYPIPTPINNGYPNTGSAPGPYNLIAEDFDKDGKTDVALALGNNIFVFWGAGNGTFSTYSGYGIPQQPSQLIAASVNGNGRQDLVVSGQDGSINILYNTAARVFLSAPTTHSAYASGIVAGNFTADGRKDLAVVNAIPCTAPCNGSVTILPNELTYFTVGKTYPMAVHGPGIATGDINGDGIPDLVAVSSTPGNNGDVSILLGVKGGGFTSTHNITLGSLSNHVFLVDMNGDGKLDLVEDGGVALGDGKGNFGDLTPFPDGAGFATGYSNYSLSMAVADFNGDGYPDIVVLETPISGSRIADVLINDGKGNLTATPLSNFGDISQYGCCGASEVVAAGPLKPGGPNDIVIAGLLGYNGGDNQPTVETFIFTNDGKGNFTFAVGPTFSTPAIGNVGVITIADFNHDGYPDLGFSGSGQFSVSTGPSFNNSNVTFEGNLGRNFVVADFNNDGWPDIAFTNSYGVGRFYNVPVPVVTPGLLTFSSASSQKVTIKNTLSKSQVITAGIVFESGNPTLGGVSPFKITSSTCGTLAVGASCSITVEYNGEAPTGQPDMLANLYISSNGQLIDNINILGN